MYCKAMHIYRKIQHDIIHRLPITCLRALPECFYIFAFENKVKATLIIVHESSEFKKKRISFIYLK